MPRTAIHVLALAVLVLLPGCGASQSPGPLTSLAEGGRVIVDAGYAYVTPGEPALVTAWLVNSGTSPVILLSASLVPVAGYPAGRLVGAGLITTRNIIEGGHSWPPPRRSQTPVVPFGAAQVHRRGQLNIAFALSGTTPGRAYVAGGLRVRYRYRGRIYGTVAWFVASACVVSTTKNHPDASWCTKAVNMAQAQIQRETGGQ